MNPDSPRTPREEMETWLTALLLGELSEGEAAAVRELIKHDPELAKLHEQLQQTIVLVRDAAPEIETKSDAQPLKLSEERRQRLLASFTIPPLEPEHRPKATGWRFRITLIEVLVVVAILGIFAVMMMPALSTAKSKSSSMAMRSNLRQIEVAKQLWADENGKAVGAEPSMEELKPYLGNREMPPVLGEKYLAGRVGEPAFAEMEAKDARGRLGRLPADTQPSDRVRLSGRGELSISDGSEELNRFAKPTKPAGPSATFANAAPRSAMKAPARVTPLPNPKPLAPVTDLSTVLETPPQSHKTTTIVLPELQANRYAPGDVVTVTMGTEAKDSTQLGFQTWGFAGGKGVPQKSLARAETQQDFFDGGGFGEAGKKLDELSRSGSAYDTSTFSRLITQGGGDSSVDSSRMNLNYSVTAGLADGNGRGGQPTPGWLGALEKPEFGHSSTNAFVARYSSFETPPSSGLAVAGDDVGKAPARGVQPVGSTDAYYAFSPGPGGGGGGGGGVPATPPPAQLPAAATTAGPEAELFARRYGGFAATNSLALSESRRLSEVQLGRGFELASQASADAPRNEGLFKGGAAVGGKSEVQLKVHSQDVVGFVNQPALPSGDGRSPTEESILRQGGAVAGEPLVTSGVLPRQTQVTTGETSRPTSVEELAYLEKRRELDDAIRLRNILNMKVATEQIDVNLPRSTAVEMVDKAVPAKERSGTFGGLFGGNYASTARVKIEPDTVDVQGLTDGGGRSGGYDPYFVQIEQEAIRSDAVLGKVVDKLNLNQEWGKKLNNGRELSRQEATEILRKQLETKSVGNTSLTDIKVKNSDADEAAKLANAVATAYLDFRLEQRRGLTLGGIKALEDRQSEVEQRSKRLQAELDQLRAKLNEREFDAPPVRKGSTNAPIPQPEILTSENNFSTFSLNVSDVSFKLAMASLEKGQMPDAASVRSEEFINAFDYRDPEPAAGAPIAFAWERARYPFAHNRDLLRFALKTAAAGRQAGRPLNIVLLLDNSGSMERADRVRIIREALRVLAGQLQPQDKLSVIMFARTARLVADGIAGDKAGEVADQVSGLTPQGGTNLEEAMNLAYQTATKHYLVNGINRVVMLTDGAANLGDVEPDSLKQMVEAQRKQGIALDCFGIGWDGLNDDLLEVLSRNGDGRYGFINSPEEAATDFVGQLAGALKVAASDVKVQVEFNSRRVTSYRQIGYAKHQLTKEQFRDNTVDAAEIAAQEAGNALYTVEVNPAGDGPLGTVRVRYKIPGTQSYREQSWDVPYTGNVLSLEQSSPAMRLAASASAFSEWLVASPFAGEVAPDKLLNLLRGVPEVFGADSRPKKLEWMIRQAKSLEGK